MSFDFNYKFWVATKKDLDKLIKRQNVMKRMKPVGNPLITYKIFSELYVLYADLVNKLSYCYLYTFQVQKRDIVRTLTESATRRLTELKDELKNLQLSEYIYIDKALISRKLTPYDLVVWRSPNFLYRRPPDIQNIIYENKIFMNDQQKVEEIKKKKHALKYALILVQSHERARSSRVYRSNIEYNKGNLKIHVRKRVAYVFTHKANQSMSIPVKRTVYNAVFIKPEDKCKHLLQTNKVQTKVIDEAQIEEWKKKCFHSAAVIQKAWRLYKNKKIYRNKFIFKETLYGIRNKRKITKPDHYLESIIQMYKNELLKQKLDEDFLKLMADERVRLLQQRTPWIMEDISDHIRAWFKEFYDNTGDFHPYPEAIKSGTILVLLDETMTLEEFRQSLKQKGMSKDEKKKQAEKLKLQKQKEKEKLKKEKIKEAKRRKKMKDAGIYDLADSLKTNKNILSIEKSMKQYSIDWRHVDEYLNKNHETIKEWVTEGELVKIHRELRALVDEYMKVEYEVLRRALCADTKQKYKPTKEKKPKNKKGKKKKKVKDMTSDKTLQSLYKELKDAKIIEKYNQKQFEEFIAEFNFLADDIRDEDNLTVLGPAKGDVKMVIQECMLGMGEFTVDKPKSICLIGPLNNGKKLLCNIIASELDALFMNLSPERTYKFSNDTNYFLHIVMKVAKAFQPTIIFINDVHRVFWKKVPKEEEYLCPKLLQKLLTKKILKPIKKEDKIIVLGTSDTPWSANAKLKKNFQKILLIPKSDYGTSFLLWLNLLAQYAGAENLIDYMVSALAKVLQPYNTGNISINISNTLDIRRRMRLFLQPMNGLEFLNFFFDRDTPVFPSDAKTLDKFDKWFTKSNKYCKMRKKFDNKAKKKDKKK